ncbi:MAG: hypothetical protein ACJ8AO_20375, partial [Gemmatimonadaceae bacterium]
MPRTRLLPILGLAVTLGACAGSAPPQTAPTRAPAPRTAETPAPRPAAAATDPAEKPAPARQDSEVAKPAADSERAGVAPGVVQRRVVEVFGDTAAESGAVTPTDVEEEVEGPEDEGGMSTDAYASNE